MPTELPHTLKMGDLSLENRIGEGKYRVVYRHSDYAFKVLKPYVKKDYGPFHVKFPTSLYVKSKFGIIDFNKHEYDNYLGIISQVPEEMRDSFTQIFEVFYIDRKSISINELVINADGQISKTLRGHGPVKDPVFWERLQKLEDLFLSRNIPYFDIRDKNIAVKQSKDGHMIPVFIAYKRVGIRTYPLQLHLLTNCGISRRIKRRFLRIRELYKPN